MLRGMDDRSADAAASDRPPEPPELEALARRWLDLWQDHWAATAADPHAAAEMARLFRMMAGPLAPFAAAWGTPWSGAPGPTPPGTGAPGADPSSAMDLWARAMAGAAGGDAASAEAPGAAPAAAPPGDGAGGLAELADRLAAVERRIGQLDDRLAGLADQLDRLEGGAGKRDAEPVAKASGKRASGRAAAGSAGSRGRSGDRTAAKSGRRRAKPS